MTIEEMFNHIGNNMIKGLMVHSQLVDYFGFLGFEGYQKCHLYHYFDEAKNFKDLGDYYLKHYNRLLAEDRIDNPKEGSYTNYLIDHGDNKILKKVGEEATEAILAFKDGKKDDMIFEVADLIYHLTVEMQSKGVSWNDIEEELKKR